MRFQYVDPGEEALSYAWGGVTPPTRTIQGPGGPVRITPTRPASPRMQAVGFPLTGEVPLPAVPAPVGLSIAGPQLGGIFGGGVPQLPPVVAAAGGLLGAAAPFIGPALGGLAGLAIGSLFGGGDDDLDTPFEEGLRWPWETPAGEGFIAPWTQQVRLPNGQIGQIGVGYPSLGIAKSWSTGTAVFFLLVDGRITVERKNGTWKTYRPQKMIVISRNPRISAIAKLDRAHKRVAKLVRKYGPRYKATKQVPSPYLSAVERKALKG